MEWIEKEREEREGGKKIREREEEINIPNILFHFLMLPLSLCPIEAQSPLSLPSGAKRAVGPGLYPTSTPPVP